MNCFYFHVLICWKKPVIMRLEQEWLYSWIFVVVLFLVCVFLCGWVHVCVDEFASVCVCCVVLLCVGMHICVQVHVHVCLCLSQRRVRASFLNNAISLTFEANCHIGMEFAYRATMADWQAPGICLSPIPECWDYNHVSSCPAFLFRLWGLNADPYTFKASTELSSHAP